MLDDIFLNVKKAPSSLSLSHTHTPQIFMGKDGCEQEICVYGMGSFSLGTWVSYFEPYD